MHVKTQKNVMQSCTTCEKISHIISCQRKTPKSQLPAGTRAFGNLYCSTTLASLQTLQLRTLRVSVYHSHNISANGCNFCVTSRLATTLRVCSNVSYPLHLPPTPEKVMSWDTKLLSWHEMASTGPSSSHFSKRSSLILPDFTWSCMLPSLDSCKSHWIIVVTRTRITFNTWWNLISP